MAWTLRRLQPVTPRGLLAAARRAGGALALACGLDRRAASRWRWWQPLAGKSIPRPGSSARARCCWLPPCCSSLACSARAGLPPSAGTVTLGLRSAAYRPGRSILCIALIASATFVIVSVDAFRREGSCAGTRRIPAAGRIVLPLIHDPDTAAGREALNIPPLEGRASGFRSA